MPKKQPAFTLIELSAVLVIVAAVAGVVALKVREPLRQHAARRAMERLADFDRLSRAMALEKDVPLRMVVDLGRDRLRRTDASGRQTLGAVCELPDGWTIIRLHVRGHDVRAGRCSLSVSPRGLSPAYAVWLSGPSGQQERVLFAGLTGQMTRTEDDDETLRILQATTARAHPG